MEKENKGAGLVRVPSPKHQMPNGINLHRLAKLLAYSDRYQINIQFWPKQIVVYIMKDMVKLKDFGGDFEFAIEKSIEYLDRINQINNKAWKRKNIRKQFEAETGIRPANEYGAPDIDYMIWLEGKLIDALNPSSESSSTPSKCDKENCQMSYMQQIDDYFCMKCQVTGLSNR